MNIKTAACIALFLFIFIFILVPNNVIAELQTIKSSACDFNIYEEELDVDKCMDAIMNNKIDIDNENTILFLRSLNSNDLKLLRNTILAKNGYAFKTKALQDYFKEKEWYVPRPQGAPLSQQHEKIISIIRGIENDENTSFGDFVKLFKPIDLPFKFKKDDAYNKYGNVCFWDNPNNIPNIYVRKFLTGNFRYDTRFCAFGELIGSNNYKALFYLVDHRGLGLEHCIATFSLGGKLISNKSFYSSGGDNQSSISGSLFIDKTLIIDVKINHESGPLTHTHKEKYIIDSIGKIKRNN